MKRLLASTPTVSWRLLATALTGLLGWYIISAVLTWYRLRHIKGPVLASFSHLWAAKTAISGRQLEIYNEVEAKYGRLARIGPNLLITSDPETVRKMGMHRNAYNKGLAHEGSRLNPYHSTLFITCERHQHDALKAKLLPGYSGRDVPGLERAVDEQLMKMIHLIRRKYMSTSAEEGDSFREVSLVRVLMYFPLDVIFHLSVSKHTDGEPSCSDLDEDPYGFYEALERHLPQLTLTVDVPWMRRIVYSPLALRLFGPKESDKQGMGSVMRFTNEIVRRRFAELGKPGCLEHRDMLGSFMKHGLTQIECEVETAFMFGVGSDTTAAAIKITMLYILATSRVYQRLKAEVAEAVRQGKVSNPITQAEARELPYLQAVIYEGIRMRPATSNVVEKEVPPGGDTILGHFIPGGTNIGTNYSAVMRLKELFGQDSDTFRPERFLELDEARLSEMRRNVELVFGTGRYMCAGKPVAMMELNKVYFELFRSFDFQLLDVQHPMDSESFSLFRDRGLRVRVTKASSRE